MLTNSMTVLAALLLALPVVAQSSARKQTDGVATMKVMKGVKSVAQAKAERCQQLRQQTKVQAKMHQGRPFRSVDAAGLQQATAQKVKTPLRDQRPVVRPFAFGSQQAPLKTFRASGEVVDEHNIITAPAEGVRQVYSRAGGMYINEDGMQVLDQTGNVHIVMCADGTVYIRDILASYPTGAWVKGTRDGSTITVPTRQPLLYNAVADVTYSFGWGYAEEIWGTLAFSYYGGDTATFTVDDEAKTITLQNPVSGCFLGLFWDNDDAFANFGDYNTVWTYVSDFEPMEAVTISNPGLTTETWYVRGHKTIDGKRQLVKGQVAVAINGTDVYLKGIFADFADGWMKGTLTDGVVTFSGLQVQGTKDGQTVYAVGEVGGDLVNFQLSYDAEQHVFTSQNALLANTSNTDVVSVDGYADFTISQTDPDAPIENLPYENNFTTENDFEWFTVIDANGDESTWHYFNGEGFGQASYQYNSNNAADDWLVSPAFKLEAGKTYSVAVDMNCSAEAFVERFEVKMGQAATAEAMTQEVIASTNVATTTPTTYQNKLVTVSETGIYYFGVHAISDADLASLRVSKFVVDETILNAPGAVTDLNVTADSENKKVTVFFNAPTVNVGGAEMSDNMTITIGRDGETIQTYSDVAPGSERTYTDENVEPGKHIYSVTAANSHGTGETVSQQVSLSAVYDIPFVADFTEDGTYDLFTTINANDDAAYWADNGFYAGYEYSSENDADDYLVTPGLRMEAGKRYAISVDAEAGGDYEERFEVVVGKEATAEGLLANVVIAPTEIIGSDGRATYEGIFTCQADGIYFAAVHCISDADKYSFWVHRLAVEVGPALTAPAAPTLMVMPGAQGAKKADIVIAAPSQTINGDELTNITKMELVRNGEVIGTFEGVTPGSTIEYTDETISESGTYTYQAIPYSDQGIGEKSQPRKVYVGFDIPADVANVKVKDLGTSVQLTWDAVTETGANGGYVNPAEVTYKVLACDWNSTYLISDEPVATVTGQTTCTVDFDPSQGEQGYQAWLVVASSEAGQSDTYSAQLATLTTGEPYPLPMVEGFADSRFHYYCDFVGKALISTQSSDDDGYAMALASQQPNTMVAFTTGKISLKDVAHPTLKVDVAGFGADNFVIVAAKNGDTDHAVTLSEGETLSDTGYKTVTVDLSSVKDADYILLGFMARIPTATVFDEWTGEIVTQGDALLMDNIRIYDKYDHNVSIALAAPETLQAGMKGNVMASVSNWGESAATGFTVTIKRGDEVLKQQTVSEPLASFVSTTIVADVPTSVFTETGDMTITATVEYAADQKADDNQMEAVIGITAPVAPAPMSLAAEDKGDNGVDLSWTAPAENVVFTESFENGMGGWTNIDSDGDGKVWTWSKLGETDLNMTMQTNSGLGSVYSESYDNSGKKALTPDNWLVSPRMVLDGTLSFYAMGQDPSWCDEHFAVYVSTGDPADPASFTQVTDELVATGMMSEYTVDLSSYAGQMGHVAIRHFNVTDQYVLVVDDITYTMGGQPERYNVYYEQTLVATIEGGVTTYTVAGNRMLAGERQFAVTAVYDNGQESSPATATITVTTAIEQVAADGKPVDVYSVDGKLVRRQATTFSGLKGLYVVNGKKVMVK